MAVNLRITEDTQVHMTAVHSRNKQKKKTDVKRTFNLVINGLLLSSTLIGSVLLAGCGKAPIVNASPNPIPTPDVNLQQTVNPAQAEETLVSNLRMATKVIQAAIDRNEWSLSMLDTLQSRLTSIEAKLAVDGKFTSNVDIATALTETDTR